MWSRPVGYRTVLATSIVVVLAVVLPALPFLVFSESPLELSRVLILLCTSYCALRLGFLVLDGRELLLSLTFWLFAYIWLGLFPLMQMLSGQFPLQAIYSEETLTKAAIVVLTGLVSYDTGGLLSRASRAKSALNLSAKRLEWRRVAPAAGVGLAISTALVVGLKGGPYVLFSAREVVHDAISVTAGGSTALTSLYRSAVCVPPLISVVVLLVLRRSLGDRGETVPRATLGVLLTTALLLLVVTGNPMGWPRFWVGTVLISIGFVVVGWRRHISMATWIVVLLFGLLIVLPALDVYRFETEELKLALPGDSLERVAYNGSFDAFQGLVETISYADNQGVLLGRNLSSILLFWVPRAMWPSKPASSSVLVMGAVGVDSLNKAVPLWGEAFLDGGLVAVMLAFLGYGYIVIGLERSYLRRSSWPSLPAVLIPVLAAYQPFLLRGSLVSTVAYLAALVVGLRLFASKTTSKSSASRLRA